MSQTNSNFGDDTSESNNTQQKGIFSIMEALEESSKPEEKDKDELNNSLYSFSASQKQFYNKAKKIKRVQVQDPQLFYLKNQFEDTLKNKDLVDKGSDSSKFKKLLDDAIVIKKEKEKKLIQEYTTLEKLNNAEQGDLSKSNNFNSSFRSIQLPTLKNSLLKSRHLDKSLNNTTIVGNTTQMYANTTENISMLQGQIYQLEMKLDKLVDKQILEENKTNQLVNMEKQLTKSKHLMNEEILNYNKLNEQYDIQITQANEKTIKYDLEGARLYVDITRLEKSVLKDENSKVDILENKQQEVDETKQDLTNTYQEYQQLQHQIDKATDEYDKTLCRIEEQNNLLGEKYKLMIESRNLIKQLDDFDRLTRNFIYRTPEEEDVDEIENQLKIEKEKLIEQQRQLTMSMNANLSVANQSGQQFAQQQMSQEEQDLMDLMQMQEQTGDSQSNQVPIYRQGTILQRLREFFKHNANNLDLVVDKIIEKYNEQNMENNTFSRRLQDLQEQKRVLVLEHSKLVEERKNMEAVQLEEVDEQDAQQGEQQSEDEEDDQIQTRKGRSQSAFLRRQQTFNEVTLKSNLVKFQFVVQIYLYFNEMLFRMAGMTGVMKSIVNKNASILKDYHLQNHLFNNELFQNLESMLRFSIANKSKFPTQTLDEDKNKKMAELEDYVFKFMQKKPIEVTKNMLEIKNIIIGYFGEDMIKKINKLCDFLQKNYLIQYFCNADDYREFCIQFEQNYKNKEFSDKKQKFEQFQEDIVSEFRDKGSKQFNKIVKQCLDYLVQYLKYLRENKNKIIAFLRQRIPETEIEKIVVESKFNEKQQQKLKTLPSGTIDTVIRQKVEQYKEQCGNIKEPSIAPSTNASQHGTQTLFFNPEPKEPESETYTQGFKIEIDHIEQTRMKYQDMLEKKKLKELQVQEEKNRMEFKEKMEPKIVARYNQNSKNYQKYMEDWKFLVQQKKQFHKLTSDPKKSKLTESRNINISNMGDPSQIEKSQTQKYLKQNYPNSTSKSKINNPLYAQGSVHKSMITRHQSTGRIRNNNNSVHQLPTTSSKLYNPKEKPNNNNRMSVLQSRSRLDSNLSQRGEVLGRVGRSISQQVLQNNSKFDHNNGSNVPLSGQGNGRLQALTSARKSNLLQSQDKLQRISQSSGKLNGNNYKNKAFLYQNKQISQFNY